MPSIIIMFILAIGNIMTIGYRKSLLDAKWLQSCSQ